MRTKSNTAQRNYAPGTWRGPRSAATLLAQMADLERGLRIKELRESRHLTQEAMADALGVTLRGYQEWEAGGGIKWDNVKKLAKFHTVDADYLMNGPRADTPDPFGQNGSDRLDRMDERIDRLAELIEQLAASTAALVADSAPREKASRRSAAPRKSDAKRNR